VISRLTDKYLFDASSLVYVLKLKHVPLIHDNYTQQLTIYEVLNAIWKEAYLTKNLTYEEAVNFIEVFKSALKYLEILDVHPYEADILIKALELGITTYDASYIVLAQKNNLTLVTEDRKLREKAEKLVKVMDLGELIQKCK